MQLIPVNVPSVYKAPFADQENNALLLHVSLSVFIEANKAIIMGGFILPVFFSVM